MLMPKKVKYRKQQRGRRAGKAWRGSTLSFGDFGLKAKDIGYDDYKNLDVTGKIVIVLRHTPRWANPEWPFDGQRKDQHASLDTKQALAESKHATAVIFVNDQVEAPGGDLLMPFDYLRLVTTPSSIPALQIRRTILDAIFQSSLGETLREREQAIDRDLKPRAVASDIPFDLALCAF